MLSAQQQMPRIPFMALFPFAWQMEILSKVTLVIKSKEAALGLMDPYQYCILTGKKEVC